ncbi:MAG: 2,3-bisphosphoglycerate-dependent phosphoglycerate mutase [Akkermansia sp.]|nr:2,3-bisphosphoglycerate-dependent phosphoglycerate mutase [Akkermansia sp.]
MRRVRVILPAIVAGSACFAIIELQKIVISFMKELVLLRHGESQWNAENRFTGWADVPLSVRGRREAELAGRKLQESGFSCKAACTSLLLRAIHTQNIVLAVTGCAWVPVYKDWRLNEKHYGILQGRIKREVEQEMGEAQVFRWRRAYDCPPPPASAETLEAQEQDPRYAGLPSGQVPATESLKDTLVRVRSCWEELLRPLLFSREQLLVVAHGNSLRALLMYLRGLTPVEVEQLEIPTAQPLRFVFDDDMHLLSS